MRIADLMTTVEPFVSFEFFPPKEKEKWPDFFHEATRLKEVNPLFVSVTYGAGGTTQGNTLEIVTKLKQEIGLEPMAHLTCVGADETAIGAFLDQLRANDVENVLALRGDPPKGEKSFIPSDARFCHANDLVEFIRKSHPDMSVGVAGYPEVHPEAESAMADLDALKTKIQAGGDFIITQLFFDNALYFDYATKVKAMGLMQPIVPGILPVLSLVSVERIVELCGASVPKAFLEELKDAHEEDTKAKEKGEPGGRVRAVGIAHAKRQVAGLLEGGAPGVHLYTLNKADACLEIVRSPEVCKYLRCCPTAA
ncbi:methylenetetrahydrofolate reductase [NAD(P)H] [Oceanidesulfovibrio marinus]|uniref:Methylenetetrahydrofolate reductase n=1 Tax=Oceanidesulfovibrio marinus TaxID=370038 RepID=A0A6P1ZMM6_9BACT|nr:methylenetetrahydrofolate reductase [NAD(P)H] [Oceanidesulfovibrio marinus]QJT09030.1 methylenetetrahydrofolate reductase [NAD(P)H] [Oceanidesulfovibrio marinus]TVM36544.1 methylenetetrahydrofolate reductase [NAD(P)H] [Oceanidesulfovibrio marinus]